MDITEAILYGLAFLFFLFITIVVISIEPKQDKIILAMLIFLQLTVLSRLAFYIILAMYKEGAITND